MNTEDFINMFKHVAIIKKIDEGNLLKGIDNKTVRRLEIEPNKRVFTYVLFSVKYTFYNIYIIYIREQNGLELHYFLYVISSKIYFFKWKSYWVLTCSIFHFDSMPHKKFFMVKEFLEIISHFSMIRNYISGNLICSRWIIFFLDNLKRKFSMRSYS